MEMVLGPPSSGDDPALNSLVPIDASEKPEPSGLAGSAGSVLAVVAGGLAPSGAAGGRTRVPGWRVGMEGMAPAAAPASATCVVAAAGAASPGGVASPPVSTDSPSPVVCAQPASMSVNTTAGGMSHRRTALP